MKEIIGGYNMSSEDSCKNSYYMTNIGGILKLARKQKRLTYREVAGSINVSVSDISDFEQGRKNLTEGQIDSISSFIINTTINSDPIDRLDKIFYEADEIIENNPELIEPMDEEQFNRIERLVKDVKIDNV